MKRLMSVCAAAVCAALAFAKPKAEWLPADVDFTLAAICAQKEDPAANTAWKKALTGLHPALDELFTKQEDMKKLAAEEPEIYAVVKALTGLSEDGKQMTLKSLAMGVTLPPTAEQEDNFKVVLILENPAFKMEAFDAAVKVLLDKKQEGQESKLNLVKQGDWSLLQDAEEGKQAEAVLCYKPCAQGVVFVLAKTVAEAEQWLAGAKLAANAPVAAPFAVVKKPSDCAYALKDVAELLNRYMTDAEMRKQVELQAPWLFKTHRVMLSGSLEGVNGVAKVAAATDSAEVAGQLKSALDMYRMMAAQMILPAVFQKPDAALSTWLTKSVTVEATGSEVQLKAVFEPKAVAVIVKECLELQAKQGQEVDSLFDDEEDEALSDDADDEDAEMTVEEAKKILDGIEAK
ncbi:MAG: hypothetical protein ACI4QJ_08625 [Candidatus Spyradenecus sp.]